jgi:uncharacterized protein
MPAPWFEWDEGNIEHIARHGVEPWEVEQALLDQRRVPAASYNEGGERRRAVIGSTDAGRVLIVVYTRRERSIRVVTARDASETNKRHYRRRRR